MKSDALTITLLCMSVLVLLNRTVGLTDWLTAASLVALCITGFRTCSVREVSLLGASIVLVGLLAATPGKLTVLLDAMDLAAYFAAFILLLTGLKIAAERSKSVLEVGEYLTRQPASRRFVATASGGHVLGVFLNFAAISLMAPLIQSAATDGSGHPDRSLERRQLSALLRGFAWILLWAPTTLTQAVLLTLFTEINYLQLMVLGIGTAVLMTAVGWLFDRREWGAIPLSAPAPTAPKLAILRLASVCLILIGMTLTLQVFAQLTTALALMFAAPSVTLFWFISQGQDGHSTTERIKEFGRSLSMDSEGLARSAIALGLSGFIGRSLAEVLPVSPFIAMLDISSVPGWLILSVLPIVITLGGQIALSPIIMVVFIGQLIQMFPDLPTEPTFIVFALSAGWAISMFASPNATATLLISAVTKVPPTRLTWHWNLKYGVSCYFILVLIFVALDSIQG